MLLFALAFLSGDLCLQSFSQLPSSLLINTLFIASIFIYFFLKKYRYVYLIFAVIWGFTWSAWYAETVLSYTLQKKIESVPIVIKGHIASLPGTDNWQTSFLFQIQTWEYQQVRDNKKLLVKLAWRDPTQKLKVGDQWQFRVRLKRIHGMQNPGTFDYEAWSFQHGICATGYVIAGAENKLLQHEKFYYLIDQFRQLLQDKIITYLPATKTSPWLMTLMIGERQGIAQDQWQVLRNTGTNHLMAIAGLHIGMLAHFIYLLANLVWRRFSFLMLKLPAQQAGAIASLISAFLYSALAGFSIPTQRACIMLSIFMSAIVCKRKISAWHAWALALLTVLIMNPLDVLTESFWLSFGTIALIIYGMHGRLISSGWWWKWGRAQWVISVGLIPITLFFFQQSSLISFLANCIAIPWLGYLILPFCFLSSLFILIVPKTGMFFLFIADKSLAILWCMLDYFSQLHFAYWQHSITTITQLIIISVGFLLFLLPKGFPGKWLSLLWIAPLFIDQAPKPAPNDFWLTLLDVGQGLAVVIQTQHHLLVYDAGPKYNINFDMGASVVLPYLHTLNATKLDMLVISHGDNDHIGGARALLTGLPVYAIKTSVPEKLPTPVTQYCLRGDNWQ